MSDHLWDCKPSIKAGQVCDQHLSSCAVCAQLVEPKRLTLAQLKEYDGSDKKKPIYLAIRGVIFDVSRGETSRCITFAVPQLAIQGLPGCKENCAGQNVSQLLRHRIFDSMTGVS